MNATASAVATPGTIAKVRHTSDVLLNGVDAPCGHLSPRSTVIHTTDVLPRSGAALPLQHRFEQRRHSDGWLVIRAGIDPKLFRMQDQAIKTARQLAAELGLTPVSRSRPSVRDEDENDLSFMD